jgi:hypothetical protein
MSAKAPLHCDTAAGRGRISCVQQGAQLVQAARYLCVKHTCLKALLLLLLLLQAE